MNETDQLSNYIRNLYYQSKNMFLQSIEEFNEYIFLLIINIISLMTTPQQANSLPYSHSLQSPKIRNHKLNSPSLQIQSTKLEIPLISKRLNFVERYVKDFTDRDLNSRLRKSNNYITTPRQTGENQLSPSIDHQELKQFCSMDISSLQLTQPHQIAKMNCIPYETILDQKSEERIESLGKLEVQYLRLKKKAHLPQQLHNISSIKKRTDSTALISHEEVEREIKKAIITQRGQRYFADLYLMKKGRDKIITSLSSVGKNTLGQSHNSYTEIVRSSLGYQEQVAASKQDFVKKKILEDRRLKKEKMIRGRNMNWNVYYDILALPPSGRNRLKGIQKFQAEYGIK